MQRKNLAAVAVLGIAGAAIVTTFAFVASAQSDTPAAPPADSGAVVQVTAAPSTTIDTSALVTTTKAAPKTSAKVEVQVQTTEQAKAKVQQRQAAAADESDTQTEQTLAPGETSTTVGTVTHAPPTCMAGETSADCEDDGLRNGSA